MAFPSNMENSPYAVEDHSNLITKDDDKEFRDVLNERREEIHDAAVNTASETPKTLDESTKSNDQVNEEVKKEQMMKIEQIMAAMLKHPLLRFTEMMLKDLTNNPQAIKCGCSSQHLILPPPIRSFAESSSSPSCGGCMRSSCTDCKRTPIMMPPPEDMIIRMMSAPHSSIHSPPSIPMPTYRARSYAAPSHLRPSYPLPSYPRPSYQYPAPPSYPEPSEAWIRPLLIRLIQISIWKYESNPKSFVNVLSCNC